MRGRLSSADGGNSLEPESGQPVSPLYVLADDPPDQPVKVAFYCRTNRRGPEAASEVARQLARCRAVLGRRAEITQVFFDSPEPASSPIPVASGRTLRREGGWPALAAAMTTPAGHRGFAAVICLAAESLSRSLCVVDAREKHAGHHGVPVLYADELADPQPNAAFVRQIRRSPVSSPAPAAVSPAGAANGTARAPRLSAYRQRSGRRAGATR